LNRSTGISYKRLESRPIYMICEAIPSPTLSRLPAQSLSQCFFLSLFLQVVEDLGKILSYVSPFSVDLLAVAPRNDCNVIQLISLDVFGPHKSHLNHCDAPHAPLTLTSFNELERVHAILHEDLFSHPA
jgi:hypothetical protein